MIDHSQRRENVEPERYEMRERPAHVFAVNRREFFEIAGAGLVIAVAAQPAAGQRPSGSGPLEARLHIGEDGIVTVLSGKIEEGQGALTELTMAAAEELRVPLGRVRTVLGDTDRVPSDGTTAGSRTTPGTVPPGAESGGGRAPIAARDSRAAVASGGRAARGARRRRGVRGQDVHVCRSCAIA